MFANRIAEILHGAGNEVVIIRPTISPDTRQIRTKTPEIRQIELNALPTKEDLEAWTNYTRIQQSVIFRPHSLLEKDVFQLAGLYETLFQTACKSKIVSVQAHKVVQQMHLTSQREFQI